jgi:cytochrome c oxidase assembly protein subunit 15
MNTATSRFHRLCLITLVAVYFLILVGGVVRSTGSGMGCPRLAEMFWFLGSTYIYLSTSC